jgi:hypothetical protein
MTKAAALSPSTSSIQMDVANRHAWLADTYRARGDLANERKHRLVQESILNKLIAADDRDMHLKKNWISLQRVLAWMDAEAGLKPAAISRLEQAIAISNHMIAFDPHNRVWQQQRRDLDRDIADVNALEPKGAPHE